MKRLFALTTVALSLISAAAVAEASDKLRPGQSLYKNSSLTSSNGKYTLVMQEDGNLVLYIAGVRPLWASNTAGRAVSRCIMQGDGNLVLYGYPKAIWASGTNGHPGAYLVLQDDGNAVIYSLEGRALWATGTNF